MHARSARRTPLVATVFAIGLFATQAARADAIITAGDNTIGYTGTIVDYTIQTAGIYDITATGANGGSGGYFGDTAAGRGITLGGDFTLAANQIIEIAAGTGGGGSLGGAGGGGGSFVVADNGTTPLIVAGGGGGGGYGPAGGDATLGTNTGNGVGGSGGSGSGGGGGGASFSQNGSDNSSQKAHGGVDFGNGLAGGFGVEAYGGFGGGGGGGFVGGGGGGGYDGGNGGNSDGSSSLGGTSYLAPGIANLVLPSTFNTGGAGSNGFITINFVADVTSVPEPGSLALLATGLLGLGALTRRRKSH